MIKTKSSITTGIDISDRSIEIVEIEKKGNRIKRKEAISKDLPLDTVIRSEINHSAVFDRVFNDLLDKSEKLNFNYEQVILSIPEEFITHEVVSLELETEEKDIEQLVLDNLKDKLLKQSPDWQYDIIEVQVKDKTQYIFTGIPKDKLRSYIQYIAEFGVEVDIAEPDSTSLARNIDFSETGDVVVDFGGNKIILYFFVGGLLYKRSIIKWGGDRINAALAEVSKLSKDKEEKFFQRIGYGAKASESQKKIIREYFEKFNKLLEKFLKEINNDFGIEIKDIYVTGGLSKITGLKSLLPENINYQRLQPRLIFEDKFEYMNSIGSALRSSSEDINLLSDEIKNSIREDVRSKVESKEKEILEEEIDKNEETDAAKSNKLKQVFLEKWGQLPEDHKPDKWQPNFRLTSLTQILLLVCVGLTAVGGLIYYTANQKYNNLKEEHIANDKQTERDFVTFAFPLYISTGESTSGMEEGDAGILGRYSEYVSEVKETFVVSNPDKKITQEDLDEAKAKLEEKIRNGDNASKFIKITSNEFIIPEAVSFDEALSAADKEVGTETDNFTFTLKAKVKFAVITKSKFDIIVNQRLAANIEATEKSENYTASSADYLLIEFDEAQKFARINIYVEAEK